MSPLSYLQNAKFSKVNTLLPISISRSATIGWKQRKMFYSERKLFKHIKKKSDVLIPAWLFIILY
jgi:hypothetical protein